MRWAWDPRGSPQPAKLPLTVAQVEVVGGAGRPQAHGVDGVVHVPRHGRVVGQGQHHL